MRLIPVDRQLLVSYCTIGKRAYADHYLHLWPGEDPSPYYRANLDEVIVRKDLANPNLLHYLIENEGQHVGILKLVQDSAVHHYSEEEALLVEKIYLLKSIVGQGIGSAVMAQIEILAKEMGKQVIWLDTMKQGPALQFYLKSGFKMIGEKDLDIPGVIESQRPMFILAKKI